MSNFYVPIDLSHTALLLSDVQTQILSRFPPPVREAYLTQVLSILNLFRTENSHHRANDSPTKTSLYDEVPLIVHHVLPFGINSNAFVSPYNKLSSWVSKLEASGFFSSSSADPNHPDYAIPDALKPADGWGSKDEIILSKLQPGCFSSSDLLAYFRARGIKHVVLCGLMTMGSVLGTARLGVVAERALTLSSFPIISMSKEETTPKISN